MSRAAISLIQTGLRDLGYDPGKVDGLWGPKTQAASVALVAANGVGPASQLTPSTSAELRHGTRLVDEVVVHCSATRPDWMEGASLAEKRAEIRRWHIGAPNLWSDIGYHWLIDRDGKVIAGRKETDIGAHVGGHNTGKLGVCLIGGHGSNADDLFPEHFTDAQDASLRQLLLGIGMRTRIRRVSGHNEYDNKACPGFNVPAWLKGA